MLRPCVSCTVPPVNDRKPPEAIFGSPNPVSAEKTPPDVEDGRMGALVLVTRLSLVEFSSVIFEALV
jgi:hypothetical protein